MKFDYNEYYKILFVASLCIMVASVIMLLISSCIFIHNKTITKTNTSLILYFVTVIILIYLFSTGLFPFRHGIHLIVEKEFDKVECVGEITNIKKSYGNNKYVYNGKNVFAYDIIVNNKEYYIMYLNDLKIGDKVGFEYLPKSRIILNIQKYPES